MNTHKKNHVENDMMRITKIQFIIGIIVLIVGLGVTWGTTITRLNTLEAKTTEICTLYNTNDKADKEDEKKGAILETKLDMISQQLSKMETKMDARFDKLDKIVK